MASMLPQTSHVFPSECVGVGAFRDVGHWEMAISRDVLAMSFFAVALENAQFSAGHFENSW